MKYFKIIIFLIYLNNAYSQNTKNILVEYKYASSMDNKITLETLIANSLEAVYEKPDVDYSREHNKVESDNETNEIKMTVTAPKVFGSKNYHYPNNQLYIKYNNYDKKIFKDDLPEFKWNVNYTETKKIGNFICKKATTNFRGTNMKAWYTDEINVPFGPWKFKGLPGLILEIYNVNDFLKFHWIANKVVFPYKEKFNFNFNSKLKVIPFKEFIEEGLRASKEESKTIEALLPRGGTVTIGKPIRLDIEKIYEWEK